MEKEPIVEDSTAELRNKLAEELDELANSEDELRALRSFRKGVFLVPGETVSRISNLIDKVEDPEDRKRLTRLYADILEKGLS